MQKEKADAAVRPADGQTDRQIDGQSDRETDWEWSAAIVSRISLLIEYAFISWGHRRRRPCRRCSRRTHKGSAQQQNCVKDLPACLAGAAASSHSVCVRKQQKDTTTHQHTDTHTHTQRTHQHTQSAPTQRQVKGAAKISGQSKPHTEKIKTTRTPKRRCLSTCACVCVCVSMSVCHLHAHVSVCCLLFLGVIVIWQLQFSHFIEFYTKPTGTHTHTERAACLTDARTHTHTHKSKATQ